MAVVGTLSQSDYRWGPSANQITGACTGSAHAGVARAGVVGTLSQSDYTGVAHAGSVCTGLCVQGWWGHLANQITQGCTCRGCACRAACVGVAHAGLHAQGLHTRVHTQGVSQLISCIEGVTAIN